jgi:hypothetical protein
MNRFTKNITENKYILSLFVFFFSLASFAQTYSNPGGTISTCSGTFYDTGGSGGTYANSQNITTTFCSNAGNCVRLAFTAFDLESSFDYLYVYDGSTTAAPLLGTYTGATLPGTFTSSTGCITIRFTSDGSVTYSGWAATISCVACSGGGSNYNNPGGTITTCSGTFYDTGGLGSDYTNSQNITTTFCSGTADAVQLAFSAFSTESCCDFMTIYDGPTTGSPVIGTYGGTTSPGTVTASGTCLTIVFTSDGSVTGTGWAATISCVTAPPTSTTYNNPGGTITTCSGTFYDTGGLGSDYTNNQNITTTFCSGTSDCIQLAFSSFNTESCCDNITIYDGPSAASPLIGSYAGTTSPGTITASTGCLTIVFTSDGSVTAAGWAATISCVTTCSAPPSGPPTNVSCDVPNPICSGSPIVFTAQSNGTAASTVNPGNDYDCLFSSPNPSWYYLEIATGGNLAIDITAGSDIDFELWGPFPSFANAVSNCNSYSVPIDCSYSSSAIEQANATGVVAGEVYVLLVTNYANTVQTITLADASGNTAATDCSIVPLSVELSYFEGSFNKDMSAVELIWNTSSERDNSHFIVERSPDTKQWSGVGLKTGAGTTTSSTNYEMTDPNPLVGESYYRLKQFDFDGKMTTSDIIHVNRTIENNIIVYPNPTKDAFTINSNNEILNVKIVDIQGSIVYNQNQVLHKVVLIDLSNLREGMYYAQIETETGISIERISVIK